MAKINYSFTGRGENLVYIEPATRLREDYNRIADLAHKTGEAIYITKNGILDLVVMDADAFQQREHLLKLTNIVLEGKADKNQDMAACSMEEMEAMLKKLKEALEQEKVKVE